MKWGKRKPGKTFKSIEEAHYVHFHSELKGKNNIYDW